MWCSTTWTSATTPEKIVLHDINLYAHAGAEDRLCRRDRRGQDDHHQPDQPLLRHCRTARSATTASTSTRSRRTTCAARLGIVLQDTHLFTGTVMENIRYGRLDATDEECIAAAKLANADGFITPPAGRLRHHARRATAANLSPGAAPAAGHCARGGGRPAGADSGRGDVLHRHPHRGARAGRHGRA